MTDRNVVLGERWLCHACFAFGHAGGSIVHRRTDCLAAALEPYVPAADLASAREEVKGLRRALEQIASGEDEDESGNWITPTEIARAALDTTGEK